MEHSSDDTFAAGASPHPSLITGQNWSDTADGGAANAPHPKLMRLLPGRNEPPACFAGTA
ncbi:hypothetical protein L226DRAFT_531511 [Lentinus tigrinus ALCF2SS1-7]|uniref:uncharacterized protein n=1 Tax=Lentinus tigrinus ALCF2SS1-7 TaxID=1328758 RepID=UPI001165E54F|nr:hypothetical protein L226DRAFT_531511 [Lentinus tigrinus ALCF2SS1-7]